MYAKQSKVRLKGKSVSELNDEIHDRDGHCCIVCGGGVDPGEKWHHWPFGIEKEDVPEKGVLLCFACHGRAHKVDVRLYARLCCNHLSRLYPAMSDYYERHVKGA